MLSNSSKLVDFFVHDMLDYALLTSKQKQITKTIEIFDIREAVNQIT